MYYFRTISALAVAVFACATISYAATQGSLAATSTGTTDLSLTIPDVVQITGLSDITLSPATISSDVSGSTTACIYSNQSAVAGGYTVTADSGNGGVGAFVATDGTDNLSYSATWNDGGGATSLTADTELIGQTGADQTDITCGGGSNATFEVTFTATNMQAVQSGTYLDTVTLLISPN